MVDNVAAPETRLRRSPAGGRADEPPSASRIGIDIGGSGIKGGRVDLATGALLGDRTRVDTPSPPSPRSVTKAVATVVDLVEGDGPIGITFPGIVRGGVIGSAANLRRSWLGTDAAALFADRLMRDVVILNDADAAGIAEMRFGAGRGKGGVVVVVTLGTGIGTALFTDGHLVPNTELGHIIVAGKDGEKLAAASVRTRKGLGWKAWSRRVSAYLARLETLISPDLVIIGGGISKEHEKFLPRLGTCAEIVPAQLFNDAGIVGAALAAEVSMPTSRRAEGP